MIADSHGLSAFNLLNAFVNQIKGLMAGNNPVLTAARAQPLIDTANVIIASQSP